MEVMYEMGDTDFPLRTDKRLFRKLRRHFDAAKKALGEKIEIEHDPVVVEARKKHFDRLTGVAERLLEDLADDQEDFEHYGGATCDAYYRVGEDGNVQVWVKTEEPPVLFESLRVSISWAFTNVGSCLGTLTLRSKVIPRKLRKPLR